MPTRVDLPLTEITRAGVAPAAEVNADTVNNHSFNNDGNVILLVRNSDTSPHNVTIVIPGLVDGQAVAPEVTAVPASASRYIGPFPASIFDVGSVVQVNVDHATLRLSAYHHA